MNSKTQIDKLLEVKGLSTSFSTKNGEVRAVDDVSFCIGKGETLGLVGESGSGKTVTALSILQLLQEPGKIVSGEVLFQGRDLLSSSKDRLERIRGNQISMVFQEPATSFNPVYTIGTQITEALFLHTDASEVEARETALNLLSKVGIPSPDSRIDNYPHQLSGGMKQRAMIAMALSTHPKLLIADEPTTALDSTVQAQILILLRDLALEENLSVLFISHDLGAVASLSDRVAVMYGGRIVETGITDDIMSSPRHPYTDGLLNAIPSLNRSEQSLVPIPGQPPEPGALPKGCAFHPRCSKSLPHCETHVPPLLPIGTGGHESRCYLNDSNVNPGGWPK